MQNSLRMKTHPSQALLKPVTTEMLLELFPFGKLSIFFQEVLIVPMHGIQILI